MKILLFTFTLLFSLFLVHGQDNDLPPFLKEETEENTIVDLASVTPPKKIDFQFETGMTFVSLGKGYSFTSTYLIPKARINVNPKLSFSLGAIISDNKWINNPDIYDGSLINYGYNYPSLNSGFLLAEGRFDVLPWLSLNGSYMNNAAGQNDLYNAYSNINNMVGVGMDFKLTPNLSIGARMYRMEYNYNPFNSHMPSFQSPYYPGW